MNQSKPDTIYAYSVGVSSAAIRNHVCEVIAREYKPEVVWDLCCGSGAYGHVLKELNPQIKLIGTDGCFKYLTSFHCQTKYDVLMWATLEQLYNGIRINSDVVLFMDVLEHLIKTVGYGALEWLKALGRPVFLSTPLFWYEQGAVDGNRLEEHKCWWSQKEIEATGFRHIYSHAYDDRGDIGAFVYDAELDR